MARIRFRTDRPFAAHFAAAHARGESAPKHLVDAAFHGVPPAAPGDCWELRWFNDAPAGYALCCPTCLGVHFWTQALNCGSRRPTPDGGATCDHTGASSCWSWTGSAEDGTLSASPSLHSVKEKGGCGFHGHLTNGEIA